MKGTGSYYRTGARWEYLGVEPMFEHILPGPLSTQRAVEWVKRMPKVALNDLNYRYVYVEDIGVDDRDKRWLELSNADGSRFRMTAADTELLEGDWPLYSKTKWAHVGVHIGKKLLVGLDLSFPSEASVARLLSVTRSTVNRWFKGKSQPSAEVLCELERVFGFQGLVLQKAGVISEEFAECIQGRLQPDDIMRFGLSGTDYDPMGRDDMQCAEMP